MDSNPVVHFELPAEDTGRAAAFYGGVFGWETNRLGEEWGGYVTVMTAESDRRGPLKPGAINGGIYPRREEPSPGPSVVIAVGDIEAYMKKVADAGGKVLGEPVDIPGVGRYVSFLDTEGNRGSMLQPVPM